MTNHNQKIPELESDRSYIRVRVSEDNKKLWKVFCQEKKVTLSEFIRRAANFMLFRPEFWDKPSQREELSKIPKNLSAEIRELKELVLTQITAQKQQIEELKLELSQLSREDPIRETEYFKEVIKSRLKSVLTPEGMTLDEIRANIPGAELQQYLFPAAGRALSLLDRALAELIREGQVTLKNNRYSSSESSEFL